MTDPEVQMKAANPSTYRSGCVDVDQCVNCLSFSISRQPGFLTITTSKLGSTFLRKTSVCYAVLEGITEELRGRVRPPFAIT